MQVLTDRIDPVAQGVLRVERRSRPLAHHPAGDLHTCVTLHLLAKTLHAALKLGQLGGLKRAQVHQHGSAWGNSVHAPTAFDDANVEGGLGVLWYFPLCDLVDRAAHGMNGARGPKGPPTMPTWPCKGDFQAGAADACSPQLVNTVPLDCQHRVHLSLPGIQ